MKESSPSLPIRVGLMTGPTHKLGGMTPPHAGNDRIPCVYFIQVGDDGPIKIGWAYDPKKRRGELQCAHHLPLHILKTIPGGKRAETQLHRAFGPDRIRGEWFRPSEALLEFLRVGGRIPLRSMPNHCTQCDTVLQHWDKENERCRQCIRADTDNPFADEIAA